MVRLIDADALNYVRVRIAHDDGTIGGYNAVVPSSEIKNAPTVDAVPVIRCKDCKHWDGYYCHNEWWGDGYGNYTPPIKTEEGFCDWAERREE